MSLEDRKNNLENYYRLKDLAYENSKSLRYISGKELFELETKQRNDLYRKCLESEHYDKVKQFAKYPKSDYLSFSCESIDNERLIFIDCLGYKDCCVSKLYIDTVNNLVWVEVFFDYYMEGKLTFDQIEAIEIVDPDFPCDYYNTDMYCIDNSLKVYLFDLDTESIDKILDNSKYTVAEGCLELGSLSFKAEAYRRELYEKII